MTNFFPPSFWGTCTADIDLLLNSICILMGLFVVLEGCVLYFITHFPSPAKGLAVPPARSGSFKRTK